MDVAAGFFFAALVFAADDVDAAVFLAVVVRAAAEDADFLAAPVFGAGASNDPASVVVDDEPVASPVGRVDASAPDRAREASASSVRSSEEAVTVLRYQGAPKGLA